MNIPKLIIFFNRLNKNKFLLFLLIFMIFLIITNDYRFVEHRSGVQTMRDSGLIDQVFSDPDRFSADLRKNFGPGQHIEFFFTFSTDVYLTITQQYQSFAGNPYNFLSNSIIYFNSSGTEISGSFNVKHIGPITVKVQFQGEGMTYEFTVKITGIEDINVVKLIILLILMLLVYGSNKYNLISRISESSNKSGFNKFIVLLKLENSSINPFLLIPALFFISAMLKYIRLEHYYSFAEHIPPSMISTNVFTYIIFMSMVYQIFIMSLLCSLIFTLPRSLNPSKLINENVLPISSLQKLLTRFSLHVIYVQIIFLVFFLEFIYFDIINYPSNYDNLTSILVGILCLILSILFIFSYNLFFEIIRNKIVVFIISGLILVSVIFHSFSVVTLLYYIVRNSSLIPRNAIINNVRNIDPDNKTSFSVFLYFLIRIITPLFGLIGFAKYYLGNRMSYS
jgi:hypothetical protein